MNREMLDLLKSRTTKEGLPIFIDHDAVIAALGTNVNITLIPMSLDEVRELMIAEGGLSIGCTMADEHELMYGYCKHMAKRENVHFERCNFSDPRSGAKLHSGVYTTVITQELDVMAALDTVVNFWYVTTRADLIR